MLVKSPVLRPLASALAIALVLGLSGCDSAEDRLAKHVESGLELLEKGETARAAVEFRNALQIDENNVETHLAMVRLYEREANLSAMVGHLRKVLEIQPDNFDANLRMAQVMLLARALDQAKIHADIALRIRPDAARALSTKAAVALQTGETDEALTYARRALEVEPNLPPAGIILVSERMQAEDYDGALSLLEGLLAAHPDDMSLSLVKVQLLERQGRIEEIGPFLKKMVVDYPNMLDLQRMLSRWHLAQGDTDGAIEVMKGLAERQPDNAEVTLDIARLIYSRKSPAAARDYLVKSAEAANDRSRFAYQRALAILDWREGRKEPAIALLESVAADSPVVADQLSAKVQLAQFLVEEDRARSEELVREVLARDSASVEALALSAAFKIERGEIDTAILELRRALNQAPRNVGLLRLAATAHQRNGNTKLALERLSAAVEASGYEPDLTLGYAQALVSNREAGPAQVVLTEAVRRHPDNRPLMIQLARMRLASGDWAGAEQVARQLRDSDGATAARISAAALTGQERYDESLAVLRQLTTDPKERLSSMAALVQVYLRAGKEAEAVEFLDGLLAENGDNVAALRLRAALHLRAGEHEAAERLLAHGIAAEPKNLAGYVTMSNFHEARQNLPAAMATLRDGIAAIGTPETEDDSRGLAAVQLQLAGLLERSGDYARAIELYSTVHEAQPQSVIAANNLASLLAEHHADDPAQMDRAYEIARQLRGVDVPEFQDTYGWVLFLRGQTDEAMRRLAPAAEAVPDNPYIRFHAGMVYAKLGQADEARRHLEAALKLEDKLFSKRDAAAAALAALPPAKAQ